MPIQPGGPDFCPELAEIGPFFARRRARYQAVRVQPGLDSLADNLDEILMPLPACDPGRQCQDKPALQFGMRARPFFPPGRGGLEVMRVFPAADAAVDKPDVLRLDRRIIFQDIVPDVFRYGNDPLAARHYPAVGIDAVRAMHGGDKRGPAIARPAPGEPGEPGREPGAGMNDGGSFPPEQPG